ncbi:hypothetical protein [Streptosporangium saharense]|uniref:Lipoprotein n=1 Tax=Streptosporangium saharense TaxID=1706840 RepID=A0A7W7VS83_9ACTN|nr:hypothetical protein [Streptosporangium saharense]MBB4920877.1 hypothetical protein [Streptosporangium saharense]
MTRRLRIATVSAVLVLLTTGCLSSPTEEAMTAEGPSLSETQATERVERLIRTAIAGITPPPKLELVPTSLADHPCIPNYGNKPTGKIYIIRSYYLSELPENLLPDAARKIQTNWEEAKNKITASRTGSAERPRLSGETSDDFYMSLRRCLRVDR